VDIDEDIRLVNNFPNQMVSLGMLDQTRRQEVESVATNNAGS
jgi:hypothetical protein